MKYFELDSVKAKLLSIAAQASQLKVAYDFPDAYRTSNQIDRLMNYQDRILDDMQYFHGTIEAARVTYAGSCKTCGTSIPTVVEDFATVMILGLQWKP